MVGEIPRQDAIAPLHDAASGPPGCGHPLRHDVPLHSAMVPAARLHLALVEHLAPRVVGFAVSGDDLPTQDVGCPRLHVQGQGWRFGSGLMPLAEDAPVRSAIRPLEVDRGESGIELDAELADAGLAHGCEPQIVLDARFDVIAALRLQEVMQDAMRPARRIIHQGYLVAADAVPSLVAY